MEKSLILDHLISHLLTADPHTKTRKKSFYLLQVTVLIQNKLRKRPSSNVIRLIRQTDEKRKKYSSPEEKLAQRGWSRLIKRRESQRKINDHFDRKTEVFSKMPRLRTISMSFKYPFS